MVTAGLAKAMHKRHMGKIKHPKKLLVSICLLVCLIIVAISVNYTFFQTPRYVSAESMNEYAQGFISTYIKGINFFLEPTRSYFHFYSNASYATKSFISFTHGAAIWIEPSDIESFSNTFTEQRIEVALFNGSFSTWPMFVVVNGSNLVTFLSIDLNGHPLADVGDNGSLILDNVWVNSKSPSENLYHCVIFKGSNKTDLWTLGLARNDANEVFDADLFYALNDSEEVREHYAEPELSSLLMKVLTKWHNALAPNGTITYTMLEKEYDIKQIEELARTKYGIINSTFIDNLLAYLSSVTAPAPTKTIFGRSVDDPNNWWYVTFLGGLPVLDFAFFLVIDYYRKKRPSKLTQWLLAIPPVLLSFILYDLLYYPPYDYQLASIQTVVVVALWILGPIVVYKGKEKVSCWLIAKKNTPKNTNNQTNQKTKKTHTAKKGK